LYSQILPLGRCYTFQSLHETAQFDRIHFTDEAHLGGHLPGHHGTYSPDGKLFAYRSWKDNDIRVWDTRTGQLYGKPITMPHMEIASSLVLNDSSLGDRLIAVCCYSRITFFDIYTGHLYAQCWNPGWDMVFIGDGTKLVSYHGNHQRRRR